MNAVVREHRIYCPAGQSANVQLGPNERVVNVNREVLSSGSTAMLVVYTVIENPSLPPRSEPYYGSQTIPYRENM